MAGLWFEEFEVGQIFLHAIRRTVTETDNILFSALTHNPAAAPSRRGVYARAPSIGQRIVNSGFTLGLMVGISVGDTTLGTTVANLGWDEVRFPKPVFHGDTLRVETEVIELRESQVAAGPRHRHVPASRLQSAQRARRVLQAQRRCSARRRRTVMLRSLLFVPGDSEKKLAKADGTGADALILDLEDSVAPPNKAAARELVLALSRGASRAPANRAALGADQSARYRLALGDLAAVVAGAPTGSCCRRRTAPRICRALSHYLDALEVQARGRTGIDPCPAGRDRDRDRAVLASATMPQRSSRGSPG